MSERTYRDVEIDLDDLADAVVDWFEHDGFEVQDFQEGPGIFIQARKQSLLNRLSATGQALNVRLSPLSSGFRVQVSAGEWLDKGIGAAAALALRALSLPLALGAGVATGFGIYQQLKLPEQLLEFIDLFVDRHGLQREEAGLEPRRGGRRPPREDEVDAELAELKGEPPRRPAAQRPAAGLCPACDAELRPGDKFCWSCGAPAKPADEG